MNTVFDIAATISSILWPAVIIVFIVLFRKKLPNLLKGISSRISNIEVAGISIELAKAEAYVHEWSLVSSALDLRHKATAVEVNDSTVGTFFSQLLDEKTADYAEINLGQGEEWLSSRLYIMSIIFQHMRGIRCFVFLENSLDSRRKYLGWADTEQIRWVVAKKYPWLEKAYAEAYSTIMTNWSRQNRPEFDPIVVSDQGRIAYPNSFYDPNATIELIKEFLQRIQQPATPMPSDTKWVNLDDQFSTWEHAEWITAEKADSFFGRDFTGTSVHSSELRGKGNAAKLKILLEIQSEYIAVVDDKNRLEYLVNRKILLEQMAQTAVGKSEGEE